MDVQNLSEIVTTIGFPALSFIMAGFYVKYREDKNDQKFKELSDHHSEEMKQMIAAFNNNTLAIQKLTDELEKIYDKGK